MIDIEEKKKEVLDFLDHALASIGFCPVIRYREKMAEYARQQAEDLCKELIKRGEIDTMPDISVAWDEASRGPVVTIELPPGYLKAKFEFQEE